MEEYLQKVYSDISETLKFSEAKNAALITLNSAIIVCVGNPVFNNSIFFLYRILFLLATLLLMIPLSLALLSFRSITESECNPLKVLYSFIDTQNKTPLTPKKYMYFAYIHKYFAANPKKYLEELSGREDGFEENSFTYQIASQIVDLSKVIYRKLTLFDIAIKIELVIWGSCCLGLLIVLFIEYHKCFL